MLDKYSLSVFRMAWHSDNSCEIIAICIDAERWLSVETGTSHQKISVGMSYCHSNSTECMSGTKDA